jgi:AraC family transcriptional regulator
VTSTFAPITLGESIRIRDLQGSIVTETEHPATRLLPRHAHEHANLALIRRGNFVETVGTRAWECAAGSAIYKPAGADHTNRYGPAGMSCLVIELLPATLEDARTSMAFDDTAVIDDARLAHLTGELHQEMRNDDLAAPLALEGLVLLILAAMLRVRTPRERQVPQWLEAFRAALHERCVQSLRIGDLARELGVHPTHAVREFRRRLGTTPGDYVRRLRVARACELLRRGFSPAQAAAAAGFSHQSHLTRLFRRYLAVTPRQYAESIR